MTGSQGEAPATPRVGVAIVNWNGWSDTRSCIESLREVTYAPLHIVIVDNGSDDDSVERILDWLRLESERKQGLDGNLPDPDCELIEMPENLGFAAGTNAAIRRCLESGCRYVLALNNDTLIEADALSALVEFLEAHEDFAAVSPQIRLHPRQDLIWNCGGYLTWTGSRRYLYAGRRASSVPKSGFRRITFITGCAALLRASFLQAHGLLSERFFHGEEDYAFSLKVRRSGLSMACVFSAVVYHKVSQSIDRIRPGNELGQAFNSLLNRYLDLRGEWSRWRWFVWRHAALCYILPMLRIRYGASMRELLTFRRRLLSDSRSLQGTTRKEFLRALAFPSDDADNPRAGSRLA